MTISESEKQRLFHAAIELSDLRQRQAFLDAACGADAQLRAELESLLNHDATAGAFLDSQSADLTQAPAGKIDSSPRGPANMISERAGAVLAGRYKLLEEIGEGGMGTVWVAEQSAPVRRKVAIKLVKAGMDSRQVLARFEAERQALALMDHPNIAKVFDGGVTEQGRPFFVMEYVKGVPLTTYCDQARLGVPQRLELFVAVCQAVQHAHQKGIIHRDLKPSNILICLYDGRPVPKVIDFGLAKAVHQSLTDQTLHTAHGMMLGTPLYMSPEQAEFNNLDIDTRSDIYSLGVILYELLTGTTPLERKQLHQAAFNEVLRLIKEVEPPKPSTRLSGSASLPSVAAQRGVEPRLLRRSLIGDLDWIVMKALDKERSRRYETANGLARDVERYLQDEPVSAGPPSAAYRLRKLVKRHKAQALAIALVTLALVGGVIGTSIGLVRARRAESLASQRLEEVEAANRSASEALAATREAQAQTSVALRESEAARKESDAVSGYLVDIFERPDASRDGRSVKVADVLDQAARKVPLDFANSPAIQIRLNEALGKAYRSLGLPTQSVALRQRQVNLVEATHGKSHSEWGQAQLELGDALQFAGKLDEAIEVTKSAVDALRATRGEAHKDTLAAQVQLAKILSRAGRDEEALPLLESIRPLVAASAELTPNESARTGVDRLDSFFAKEYAGTLMGLGRTREAIEVLENAIATLERRKKTPSQFEIIMGNDLAVAYGLIGAKDKASKSLDRLFKLQRDTLSPDHPHLLMAASNWALTAHDNGEPPAVYEGTLRDVRERRERVLGPQHPDTLQARINEVLPYFARGEPQVAKERLEAILAEAQAALGPAHGVCLGARHLLGAAHLKLGQAGQAADLFREVLRIAETAPDTANWRREATLEQLAEAHLAAGNVPQAIATRRDMVQYCSQQLGPRESATLQAQASLGHLLIDRGNAIEEGLSLVEGAVREAKSTFGADHYVTYSLLNRLGECQRLSKRYDDALATQREAIRIAQKIFGPAHRNTIGARNNLTLTLGASGLRDEATKQLEQLLAEVRDEALEMSTDVLTARENLAIFYLDLNRPGDAAKELKKVIDADETLGRDRYTKALQRRLTLIRWLRRAQDHPAAIAESRRILKDLGDRQEFSQPRLEAQLVLGNALVDANRRGEAYELLRTALASPDARAAADNSPFVRGMRLQLARLVVERRDHATAASLYRLILDSLPPNSPNRPQVELELGQSEFMAGNRAAGLERVQRAVQQIDDLMPPNRAQRYRARMALGELLRQGDDPASALPVLESLAAEMPSDNVEERAEHGRALQSLAHVYYDLKRYEDALRVVRDAQTRWRAILGEDAQEFIEGLESQAQTLAALQRIPEARELFQEATRRASETLDADHPLMVRVANARADFLLERKEFAEAEQVLQDLVQRLAPLGASALAERCDAQLKLAALYRDTGKPVERRRQLDAILAAAEDLRARSPATVIRAKRDLGHLLWQQQRFDEALKLYIAVEGEFRELQGPDSLDVLQARLNQAAQHYGLRQFERAESALTALLADLPRLKNPAEQAKERDNARQLLSAVLSDSNQWAKYERTLREWIAEAEKEPPAETARSIRAWRVSLGACLGNQGRLDESIELLSKLTDELIAAGAENKGPDLPVLRHCLVNLSAALSNAGDYAQAARHSQRLFDLTVKHVGPASPHSIRAQIELARLQRKSKQWAAAEQNFREAQQVLDRQTGDPANADSLLLSIELSSLLSDQRNVAGAEDVLRKAFAIAKARRMPDDPQLITLENNLAVLLWRQGKYREALSIYQRLVAQLTESRGADHPEADVPRLNVAAQLMGLGEYAQAEKTIRELIATGERRVPPSTRIEMRQYHVSLANALRKQRRWPLAIELLQPLLQEAKPKNDEDLRFLAKGWSQVALCQLHQGKYDEARQAAERALEFQTGLNEEFGLIQIRIFQTVASMGLGRVDEADPQLVELIDRLLSERAKEPHWNFNALADLARIVEQIYERQKQPEKQDAWRAKAEAWEREFGPPRAAPQ